MPYDETLAAQLKRMLPQTLSFEERRMFGGLAFLMGGHMVCGVVGNDVVLRVGKAGADDLLRSAEAAVRPMDFTGRPIRSMVYVDPSAAGRGEMEDWLRLAIEFVQGLPPKENTGRLGQL